jgi:hypothetical protein
MYAKCGHSAVQVQEIDRKLEAGESLSAEERRIVAELARRAGIKFADEPLEQLEPLELKRTADDESVDDEAVDNE